MLGHAIDWIIDTLVMLGFRRWRQVDWDGPFVLYRCAWTGDENTRIAANRLRMMYPGRKAKWES
jgi:hypothetical protein